jgi:hypothetical protein
MYAGQHRPSVTVFAPGRPRWRLNYRARKSALTQPSNHSWARDPRPAAEIMRISAGSRPAVAAPRARLGPRAELGGRPLGGVVNVARVGKRLAGRGSR